MALTFKQDYNLYECLSPTVHTNPRDASVHSGSGLQNGLPFFCCHQYDRRVEKENSKQERPLSLLFKTSRRVGQSPYRLISKNLKA